MISAIRQYIKQKMKLNTIKNLFKKKTVKLNKRGN